MATPTRGRSRRRAELDVSATLAADERIRQRIAAGAPVVHMAFGEAGLPVHPAVVEALARGASENGYGPVAGRPPVRAAAAGYFSRRGLPTDADQILVGPGSKALLFALLSLLPGDVVLPRPSWVTYAAQAALVRKRVVPVDIGAAGGVPDPAALASALTRARKAGRRPGVLVVTLPDNPTGTLAPPALVGEVCELAAAFDLAIVSDEIYRDLAHDPDAVVSPACLAPDRTYVTSGLSKSMALGGWRIGFVRLPERSPLDRPLRGLASEVWSSLAAPMQHAAAYVLDEPAEVRDHLVASRRLHRLTAVAAYERIRAAGVDCRPPQGAFYLYPDLEPLRSQLATLGVDGAAALAELLLDRDDVAVLPGEAFGDRRDRLRFRMATSLLYGSTDAERRTALASADPAALPWIAAGLDRLAGALARIAAGEPTGR